MYNSSMSVDTELLYVKPSFSILFSIVCELCFKPQGSVLLLV